MRVNIAKRVALELKRGMVVNLGVGIPTLIQDFLPINHGVYLQSENGVLGMGATPAREDVDMDLISASKHPITLEEGASIFSSADSFAMIRGGHIDIAVLGALQVSETGEIANWAIPGADILGVGGAMDLIANTKTIIVATLHLSKEHRPKIVKRLTYPTSGIRQASKIVTEKAVFKIEDDKLYLQEIAPESSLEDIRYSTEATFEVSRDVKVMSL
ncbi:3-oxoacid CoA-transferase subunit B [Brevibacillus fluminis]|nr:3-oxoacid CoA-transferase subunit B [Brevibacillus fluminis]